jgi:hypothetical protein
MSYVLTAGTRNHWGEWLLLFSMFFCFQFIINCTADIRMHALTYSHTVLTSHLLLIAEPTGFLGFQMQSTPEVTTPPTLITLKEVRVTSAGFPTLESLAFKAERGTLWYVVQCNCSHVT